ncbi:hypothetical protein PIB30_049033 [Stylosanthes scabra]|uniref:Uncharacterized protein n=1 Tax=Stylosanthes scabra TaxID=79078 RepID=A0ABU6THW1_9FABA|nr:hypothetical protein [Stylosanthes scabra]
MERGSPNDVLIKINTMLEEAQPLLPEECCIYKVPHEIRKLNEEAYTPKIVSIGPFHHRDLKLQKMEDQKRLYCREFIERSEIKNLLESFVSCVQKLEPKIRGCYSDDIKLTNEEHVMVILVDCCFILELLIRYHSRDGILLPPRLGNFMHYDLLLLENQVPFFVLEKLYSLAFPGHNSLPSLLDLTLRYIVPDYIFSSDKDDDSSLLNVGKIAHFTDLSRKLLLTSSRLFQPGYSRQGEVTHLYCATELKEAGVKFEVKNNSSCLLDLELSGHTLKIPFIRVDDSTEVILRNLLVFEQCHCIDESYLADYVTVFDLLINTGKDVDLLIKKEIIDNWLSDSNAVARMFNGIGVNIVHNDFNVHYSRILKDLNAFCAHPWKKRVATLRRDYCNTPWKTVASIAGIFLLILTVIQTVFSILQVAH